MTLAATSFEVTGSQSNNPQTCHARNRILMLNYASSFITCIAYRNGTFTWVSKNPRSDVFLTGRSTWPADWADSPALLAISDARRPTGLPAYRHAGTLTR